MFLPDQIIRKVGFLNGVARVRDSIKKILQVGELQGSSP